MKALVTGGTGLLGSHIAERLVRRGDTVRALARPGSDTSYLRTLGVEIVPGDITQAESLPPAAGGVEAVFHAAAMVTDWAPWREFQAVTIEGTRNILEAASQVGVPRFLHVSTDSVYPHAPKLRGATFAEDSPLEERPPSWDPYQRAKLAAERLAWEYHDAARIKVSAVRPGIILGERDRSIMPGLVQYLSRGAAYIGSGRNRLPCVYAGDVAELCILAATRSDGVAQAYNASAEQITQRELFQTIAEALGAEPPKRAVPFRLVYWFGAASELLARLTSSRRRPTMTRMSADMIAEDYDLDTAKARRELGWKPEVPVREAIRRSVQWIQARREPAGPAPDEESGVAG